MISSVSIRNGFCAAVLMGLASTVLAQESKAPEADDSGGWSTLAYKGVPIVLEIKAGEESILQFPWRVEMGTSSEMLDMVKMPSIGDSVFFTPRSTFGKTRFYAEAVESGAMFQIDIIASDDSRPRMVRFMDARADDAPPEASSEQASAPDTEPSQEDGAGEYSWATVARFALQSIYSPERLIEPLVNLNEVRTDTDRAIENLVPGARVVARPWAQWQTLEGMYVIAVELQNLSRYGVEINPTKLRHSLEWKASAYWSNYLYPTRSLGDRTTMVIVSPLSWEETTANRELY